MSVHSVDSNHPMYSDDSTWILVQVGCPIRKSPDQRLFAPTRGLSQLITSFIVSMCLGIPRTPLVALPKCCSWRWLGYIESPDWVIQSFQFPNCQKAKILSCGADRDRTCDLLNANQALSQLSYSPINWMDDSRSSGPAWTRTTDLILIRDAL